MSWSKKNDDELGTVKQVPTDNYERSSNPRTGQVHARVYPRVRKELLAESVRRGVQQGVIIEEAWELYKKYGTQTDRV